MDDDMQRQSDHDLLLTLNTKFDLLSADVKEMNDGIRTRIRESEMRIRNLETIVDKVNPIDTYKDFLGVKEKVKNNQDEIKGIKGNFKMILIVVSAFATFVTWASGLVNNILSWFNIGR